MKTSFVILLLILFNLAGCKKTYEDTFEYRIVGQNICAIKDKNIASAKQINWIFPEIRNFSGDVVSGNLKTNKENTKYLFCYNIEQFKNEVGTGSIQSDIGVEIDFTSSVQEYNLRNYSCILDNTIKLNLSKKELRKICIN